jgi:DNA polymerase-3 subunit delta'
MRLQPVPPAGQVLPWLEPLLGGTGQNAARLLASARGAPLAALGLLEGDKLEQRSQWLEDLVQLSGNQLSPIEMAQKWYNDDLAGMLEWLLGWLHDLTRWRAGASAPMLEPVPPALEQPLQQLSLPLLHRFIEKLLVTKRQLLSSANPNKQLLLEELLMDWGVLLRASARQSSGQR